MPDQAGRRADDDYDYIFCDSLAILSALLDHYSLSFSLVMLNDSMATMTLWYCEVTVFFTVISEYGV